MGKRIYKHQRGSYRVDLIMPQLPKGRLQKASGLYEIKEVEILKVALKSLYSRGYYDLLIQWKDNNLTTRQIIEASRAEEIEDDWGLLLLQSDVALLEWGTSDHYVKENQRIHGHLVKQFKNDLKNTTVGTLPHVLKSMKQGYKGSTVQFNKIRKLILSYLRHNTQLGSQSRLYRLTARTAPFPVRSHKKKNNHNPFSLNNLDRLLDEHDIPQLSREWIWWWCLHGLRPIELYETPWEIRNEGNLQYLHVEGSKTAGSIRNLPLMQLPPSTKPVPRTTIRTHLQKMGRQLVDCRRTYAVITDKARIPRNHIARYLGHSPVRSTTELYMLTDDLVWIRDDTVRLHEWLQKEMDVTNVGSDVIDFTPYADRKAIGTNRQALSLVEVKDRINGLLAEWYENPQTNWMRKKYEVELLKDITPTK